VRAGGGELRRPGEERRQQIFHRGNQHHDIGVGPAEYRVGIENRLLDLPEAAELNVAVQASAFQRLGQQRRNQVDAEGAEHDHAHARQPAAVTLALQGESATPALEDVLR
jgi:hypothetical protein